MKVQDVVTKEYTFEVGDLFVFTHVCESYRPGDFIRLREYQEKVRGIGWKIDTPNTVSGKITGASASKNFLIQQLEEGRMVHVPLEITA